MLSEQGGSNSVLRRDSRSLYVGKQSCLRKRKDNHTLKYRQMRSLSTGLSITTKNNILWSKDTVCCYRSVSKASCGTMNLRRGCPMRPASDEFPLVRAMSQQLSIGNPLILLQGPSLRAMLKSVSIYGTCVLTIAKS